MNKCLLRKPIVEPFWNVRHSRSRSGGTIHRGGTNELRVSRSETPNMKPRFVRHLLSSALPKPCSIPCHILEAWVDSWSERIGRKQRRRVWILAVASTTTWDLVLLLIRITSHAIEAVLTRGASKHTLVWKELLKIWGVVEPSEASAEDWLRAAAHSNTKLTLVVKQGLLLVRIIDWVWAVINKSAGALRGSILTYEPFRTIFKKYDGVLVIQVILLSHAPFVLVDETEGLKRIAGDIRRRQVKPGNLFLISLMFRSAHLLWRLCPGNLVLAPRTTLSLTSTAWTFLSGELLTLSSLEVKRASMLSSTACSCRWSLIVVIVQIACKSVCDYLTNRLYQGRSRTYSGVRSIVNRRCR